MTTARLTTLAWSAAMAALAAAGPTARAALIDDFNDASLAEYTQTAVLDNNTVRGVNFASPSGALESSNIDTTPEQVLLMRGDFSLAAGETLIADANVGQAAFLVDLGIAVGATATPTAVTAGMTGDVRAAANYLFIAVRESGSLTDTGDRINGATFTTAGNPNTTQIANNVTHAQAKGLYITRIDVDDFTAGWIDASNVRQQVFAVTVMGGNAVGIGGAVGFYTDIRGAGSLGGLDNLRIVPEPASTALAATALGALALVRRRRK